MNVFEELMNQRWISKYRDKELYYRVKEEVGAIRPFLVEKLGYRIIVNSSLVKLEKLPGEALPWMGQQDFREPLDYALFCAILMFLEDREAEEQFVLSQLTEYITSNLPEGQMSWTVYANRQRLIRVMKFCIKNDLFLVDDGNMEGFVVDLATEALYENTGLSKYFMRTITQDISGFQKVEDFFRSEWMDMDEDRGVIRRHRVYRKLLLSLGMYREREADEDFNYIRHYRSIIENDIEQLVDARLQVHKSSAYLILGENADLGKIFPARNSLSDMILLLHAEIVDRVKQGSLKPELHERIYLPILSLRELILDSRRKYGGGLVKAYREMSDREFTDTLIQELESMDILRIDGITQEVELMPLIGKMIGTYPERFSGEEKEGVANDDK